MQLVLGKRGDYAIRAVLDVAASHGRARRKRREIAEAMAIPETYLARVLASLVRAGVLRATAGQNGGYELAQTPGRISLLEVIEAVEGPTEIRECLVRGAPCVPDGACVVHDSWVAAEEAMRGQLQTTTFAELVSGRAAATVDRAGGRRRPPSPQREDRARR